MVDGVILVRDVETAAKFQNDIDAKIIWSCQGTIDAGPLFCAQFPAMCERPNKVPFVVLVVSSVV